MVCLFGTVISDFRDYSWATKIANLKLSNSVASSYNDFTPIFKVDGQRILLKRMFTCLASTL